MTRPFTRTKDSIILLVRATPNAARDMIEGIAKRDDGVTRLKVRIKAVPDRGKANKAIITLIAIQLGIAKSNISIETGETSRDKKLMIVGDPEALEQKLTALLSAQQI